MINPFERKFSPTEGEKEEAEKAGGEEAVKKLEEEMKTATSRAGSEKEPGVIELTEEDIKEAENIDINALTKEMEDKKKKEEEARLKAKEAYE